MGIERHHPLQSEMTSQAANGCTVSLNGTQVMFSQNPHIPVLVGIYIEDEPEPIGCINIAKGCTVCLGGVGEDLAGQVLRWREDLEDLLDELTEVEYRLNQEGVVDPSENDSRGEADGE